MNKSTLLLLAYSVVLLSACNKEESIPPLQKGCLPRLFSVPSWYTDSIYYTDYKITQIDKSYRLHGDKNTLSRFEYNGNEVKIKVKDFYLGSWRDVIHYTLAFEDSRIWQIETNSERDKANYYYEGTNLKYIIYRKEDKLTDSIAVQWDPKGNNIARAKWYKYDKEDKEFYLANTADYSYDSKINPHKNSLHFLYDFYDCEEYSLDYFNQNNIVRIKSTLTSIRTEYTYNENNYPIYVIFYDQTGGETDRNAIEYNCE